jgi:DNA polymerase
MTTEAYVRDPRFHAQMVGVKPGANRTHAWRPGEQDLKGICEVHAVIAHHAQFDGLILSHHFDARPRFWFDTLSMARLVHPHLRSHSLGKLAEHYGLPAKDQGALYSVRGHRNLTYEQFVMLTPYCCHDVKLTYEIFKRMAPYVPRQELRLIDLTIRMFTEPALVLDQPRLERAVERIRAEKEDMLAALGATREAVGSNETFANLLRDCGVEPPTKPSPSDPAREIYAFSKSDDGMKALLDDEEPRVQALAAARLGVKSTIGETRAQRMEEMAGRGPACVYLNYAGAHTLRWSGGDKLNWQNLPSGRGGDKEIRHSVLAPPGYVIAVADLSQIECRMLNWLAGQRDVLEAFATGRDIYSEGASRFYGREITREDKLERHLGKALELGCGYGLGWKKFQTVCRGGALGGPPILLEDGEAEAAVRSYRESHPYVAQLWREADIILHWLLGRETTTWGPMSIEDGRIYASSGSWLDYTNLKAHGRDVVAITRKGPSKMYGAKLVENVVQWLSREVMAAAKLRIAERYKVPLSTHDEVLGLAPEEEADECLAWMLEQMKAAPPWCADLPLDAEGGYAREYSK